MSFPAKDVKVIVDFNNPPSIISVPVFSDSSSSCFVNKSLAKSSSLAIINSRSDSASNSALVPSSTFSLPSKKSVISSEGALSNNSLLKFTSSDVVPTSKSNSRAESISLVSSYLLKSVRKSTLNNYEKYWDKFKTFCAESESNMSSSMVSAFMIYLSENCGSKNPALMARAAIKFFYKLYFPAKKSPTDSWMVNRIVKSLIKNLSKTVKKASVIDSDIIKKLVNFLLNNDVVPLKDERLAIFSILQFCIFARFEELQSLKIQDLNFLVSGDLEINVTKAKNFENWDARKSYIAANTGGSIDPVSLISKYVQRLGYEDGLLFPSLKSVIVDKKLKLKQVIILPRPVSK